MNEETKSRLERLQAEIRLKTGKQVTQREILDRLVNDATESKVKFIDSFRELRVPVNDDVHEAFHERTVASGQETTEDDIDDIIYG